MHTVVPVLQVLEAYQRAIDPTAVQYELDKDWQPGRLLKVTSTGTETVSKVLLRLLVENFHLVNQLVKEVFFTGCLGTIQPVAAAGVQQLERMPLET